MVFQGTDGELYQSLEGERLIQLTTTEKDILLGISAPPPPPIKPPLSVEAIPRDDLAAVVWNDKYMGKGSHNKFCGYSVTSIAWKQLYQLASNENGCV